MSCFRFWIILYCIGLLLFWITLYYIVFYIINCIVVSKILNPTSKLFVWELSEILAEWCISLCNNKSFIWEWIHPTQVRSHLNTGEISLKWDDFSLSKHVFDGLSHLNRIVHLVYTRCVFTIIRWKSAINFIKLNIVGVC